MHQIFKIRSPFQVPDGTLVSPFLNCKDSESGLPFDLLDGFSLAAGVIGPNTKSKIHIMPHVTQVTFVRRGQLNVQMKGQQDTAVYSLDVATEQAVITRPGVFFQLINITDEACEVLYIVSPPYLYEMSKDQKILYDDSCVLEESWEELEQDKWQPKASLANAKERQAVEQRMAERAKGII